MKIRFSIEENEIENLTVINPYKDIENINDNECLYLDASNTLELANFEDYKQILKKWLSKIRRGGIIRLTGVDPYNLAITFINTNSIEYLNNKIAKKSIYSVFDIKKILEENKFSIKNIELNEDCYTIEGIRT